MRCLLILLVVIGCVVSASAAVVPAPQAFRQEVALKFSASQGAPEGKIQLVDPSPNQQVRVFASAKWYELTREARWNELSTPKPNQGERFVFPGARGRDLELPVNASEVRQILRIGPTNWVAATGKLFMVPENGEPFISRDWPADFRPHQIAAGLAGSIYAAGTTGLFLRNATGWNPVPVVDQAGRNWTAGEVLGVAFDSAGAMWIATRAGVVRKSASGLSTFEGKDGLPWNDFTGVFAGKHGEIWFTTHLGVIRFDGKTFHYRQGPRWLPHDDVTQAVIDGDGHAWFATAGGLGSIELRIMTLEQKATFYESEIERYIQRTPYGYVSGAPLHKPGDKSSAAPDDSDNDGLWTAMYGAGECFAYAATKYPKSRHRAAKAFEALRFLQKVTQGGDHPPPKGYVARTIRPVDWPDPNIGRLESDRQAQQQDALWKVYEPRWPKSADGKWFWKSDTSSDELDGHYFFYPLYYDFCAETEAERERVREVVRDLTDHLIEHGFVLIDHDGKPTRWGIYSPQYLNHDPNWWQERGLKSLSILSYLAVAEHVTGDAKYGRAARELIDRYAYAHNAMHPKVQSGAGSGNQSDDEMAFMCYYTLLRYSKDEALKNLMRYSFYRYWLNEAPEGNPFFNFAYAAQCEGAKSSSPWGLFPVSPWRGWHEDSVATLCGFPMDRLNWPSRNSHRLDVQMLPLSRPRDVEQPEESRHRGHLANGKVIPVENRYFDHWNTDPWALDYGGNGGHLGPGTVFLLPYYMGLYHGYIAKPDEQP